MDDLLADFIAEIREMQTAIGGEIVAGERDPRDREKLDSLFRFVHTVKGNCGFFDFPALAELSHAAEDALAECRARRREPDADLVNAVLAIIDRIGEMAGGIEDGSIPAGDTVGLEGHAVLIAALSHGPGAQYDSLDMPKTPLAAASNGRASGGDDSRQNTHNTSQKPEGTVQENAPSKRAIQRSVRLHVHQLDEMMKGVSDLVLARNEVSRKMRETSQDPELAGSFERLNGIMHQVQETVTRMRMQRLEQLFDQVPRLVRDLSQDLGKQVLVDFEGGDVELDREMIELIRDPITHIVRNAIDHGFEPPGERLRKGKREAGVLRFFARQSGNQISLAISDDGKGIDANRLAQKALDAGLHTPEELSAMSEAEKVQLIFNPGLSTANSVSAISGRGVGMDVVRNNIEKLGGSIDLSTALGEGSTFVLRLPLTLSIIPALTVACNGQTFALPNSFVDEIVIGRSPHLEFAEVGAQPIVTYRGKRVPCITLQRILGIDDARSADWQSKTLLFIRLVTDDIFAIAVDRVNDHQDVVIRPLAPAIMGTGIYAGSTLMDDGLPMLLLDIPSIANLYGVSSDLAARSARYEGEPEEQETETIQVMTLTGLDGRQKAIHLGLVRRIDQALGKDLDLTSVQPQVVLEGKIWPLAGVSGDVEPDRAYRLLRVSDGETELAYLAASVRDTFAIPLELTAAPDEPFVQGRALIGNTVVDVIDALPLFAAMRAHTGAAGALMCRIPSESDWAKTILRPLLISAGHTVISDPNGAADVTIQIDDQETVESAGAASVIHLRSDPKSSSNDGHSIYRYDRAALLEALSAIEPAIEKQKVKA